MSSTTNVNNSNNNANNSVNLLNSTSNGGVLTGSKIDGNVRNFTHNPIENGGTGGSMFAKTTTGPGGGAFPYVRFTYNHYHEQRRKIDRLVQVRYVSHFYKEG